MQDKVNELDREVTKLKAQLEMDGANLSDEQKRAAAVTKGVQEVSLIRRSVNSDPIDSDMASPNSWSKESA